MTNSYYFDYLIDCALMVGANEQSGIAPPQNTDPQSTSYLSTNYQQKIIGAVSSTVSMFPFSSERYDYPPEEFKKRTEKLESMESVRKNLKKQVSKEELQIIRELVSEYNKKETSLVETTKSSRLNRRSSKMRSKRMSIKHISLETLEAGSWGSVSTETIKNFPATYFNNNLYLSEQCLEPRVRFLPLTDSMGNRSFAIVLEFYRRFSIKETSDGHVKLGILPRKKEEEDLWKMVHVPTSVIFFSKYPYFNFFRDILSHFHQEVLDKTTSEIEHHLLEYCAILTRIPVPRSDGLSLSFSIEESTFSIPRTSLDLVVVDWDLSILFQVLSIDDIISILMALFQEQKVVLLSDDANLITVVAESILVLFRPFQWKHCYLTTTPPFLYELLDAIFPYILGIPHSLKSRVVEHHQDVILVDLQEGSVLVPDSCNLKYVSSELISQLKQGLIYRDWLVPGIKALSQLNPGSLQESRLARDQEKTTFVSRVLLLFMTFMVNLFQEVLQHITVDSSGVGKKSELLVVSLDRFLLSSQSPNVPFFREVYRTDSFNCFLDDKLRKKAVDDWVRLCTLLYPDLLLDSKKRVSAKLVTTVRKDSSESRDMGLDIPGVFPGIIPGVEEKTQKITLPTSRRFRRKYFQEVLDLIRKLDQSAEVRKVRAEVLLQSGDIVRALEEFHQVLLQDAQEVNKSRIRRIIRGLGRKELVKVLEAPFRNSLFSVVDFVERRETVSPNYERHHIEQFQPPTVPIPKSNFLEECRKADIAEFEASVTTLFSCLSSADSKSVSKGRVRTVRPDIFASFYHNWLNSSVDLPGDLDHVLEDEVLIKGTETCVRVDGFGLGRVLLTQFRLLFIPFGKSFCNVIVNFLENNLGKIKLERKIRGFGKITEVLEISILERDSKVVAWITQDTEKWFNLISEISIVNRLAHDEKDKSLLDIATEQCLMYENMVVCARKHVFFKNNLAEMTKKLLPHSSEKSKTNKPKTEEHRKYLLTKMMPSAKLLVTIDCATEVYKPALDNFELWVACMAQDKFFIKVIKVVDWRPCYLTDIRHKDLVDKNIELPSRVQNMIQVPRSKKMIICSMSHFIVILDMNNYCIEREVPINFNKDSYPICCMTPALDPTLVYFGTNNGEIVTWDSQTDECQQIIKLSEDDHINVIMSYNTSTLIIGSLYRFYIMDISGRIINTVVVSEQSNIMSKIGCFTMTNNNRTIMLGLARLPVLFEYDISDLCNVVCLKKRNLISKKEFNMSEISKQYELSSLFVGITSILVRTEGDGYLKHLWVMFKDGTVEIIDYQTMLNVTKFNAHVDVINKGILCNIKKHQIMVTVGRTDGKIILWNLDPLDS